MVHVINLLRSLRDHVKTVKYPFKKVDDTRMFSVHFKDAKNLMTIIRMNGLSSLIGKW